MLCYPDQMDACYRHLGSGYVVAPRRLTCSTPDSGTRWLFKGGDRVTLSKHSFLPTSPNWAEEGLKDEAPSCNGLR